MTDDDSHRGDEFVYTGLRFNAVYVIESMGGGQPKLGADLYDQVVFPTRVTLEGLYTDYSFVADEVQLHAKLRSILAAARAANHLPIIHFEAHCGEGGVQLADETVVTWRSLAPLLAAINEACRMNLMVVAMVCYAWSLMYSLTPSDRAPLFMLVAPPGPMSGQALFDATRAFYGALFGALDVNSGLEAMNSGMDFKDWPIRPATAEILFCRVFRRFVEELGTGQALSNRENEIVARMALARRLDVRDTAILRESLLRDSRDYRSAYDRLRERFLILISFQRIANGLGSRMKSVLTRPRRCQLAGA
ncbi:MAG: hypothetical protein U0163_17120 [Gemmatimonadaceae bacterium]